MSYLDERQRQNLEFIDALGAARTSAEKARAIAALLPERRRETERKGVLEWIQLRNQGIQAQQKAQEANAPVGAQDEQILSMAPPEAPVTGAQGLGVGSGTGGGVASLEEIFGGGGRTSQQGASRVGASGAAGRGAPPASGPSGSAAGPAQGTGGFSLGQLIRRAIQQRLGGGGGQPRAAEIVEAEADSLAAAIQENRALEQAGKATEGSRKKVLAIARSVHERYTPEIAKEISVRGFARARTMEQARKAKEIEAQLSSDRIEARQRRLREEQRATPEGRNRADEARLLQKIKREGSGSLKPNERDFLNERARLSPLSRLLQQSIGSGASLGPATPEAVDSAATLFQQRHGREPTAGELKSFMLGQGYEFPEE